MTPMLAGCKVCQGPINKKHCHLMSSWARCFDAHLSEPGSPLERAVELVKGSGLSGETAQVGGGSLAQVGEHENNGRSACSLLTWGSGE